MPVLPLPLSSLLAAVLLALPWLIAPAPVPDAVLYNQLAAVAAWGVWVALPGRADWRRAWPAVLALGLCGTLAACSGFALQAGVVPVMLAALVVLGAACGRPGAGAALPVALAFWLAGLGGALGGIVQFAAPDLADGWLVAAGTTPGRAVGNLRQPNHLATALLCAVVMTAWLWQAGVLRAIVAAASVVVMLLALAMTASRTGALSLAVLVAWAMLDRQLPRGARLVLGLTPLIYGVCWAASAGYAALQHEAFYGSERLQSGGDISSSRFAIWRNALTLLAAHPWTGVGWGRFNQAWTLTPFPDRPVAFFDHTHNLPLQLAVEIGLPAAVLVLGLLAWSLWRARGAWRAAGEDGRGPQRAALALLSLLGAHSLLEYPLWYAYFLLPAAWAYGTVLAGAPAAAPAGARISRVRWAGPLFVVAAAWAAWDHRTVEAVFAPRVGAAPLQQRIEAAQRSALFGHHADYAAVTTPPRDTDLRRFERPLRQLIDVRLLVAYIEALKANGRTAEALYAAQRLREFRRPDAQSYFKDCRDGAPPQPWQCATNPVALEWRDLVP